MTTPTIPGVYTMRIKTGAAAILVAGRTGTLRRLLASMVRVRVPPRWWRGFALPLLQRRFSPLTAMLVVAVLWAGWHLPMFLVVNNFRSFSVGTVVGWLFGLTAGSIVLGWLYNRSGGSVALVELLADPASTC